MKPELIAGLLVGIGIGCVFGLQGIRYLDRRQMLIRHMRNFPSLPQLVILYTVLTVLGAYTYPNFPYNTFNLITSAMVGVESVLLLVAKAVDDGLV